MTSICSAETRSLSVKNGLTCTHKLEACFLISFFLRAAVDAAESGRGFAQRADPGFAGSKSRCAGDAESSSLQPAVIVVAQSAFRR